MMLKSVNLYSNLPMKKMLIPAMLILVIACSKKTTSDSLVQKMSSKYPGYTEAQFQEGKSLYEGNCGRCHDLKKPSSLDEAGWTKIVPPMVGKVNKKAGSTVIDDGKQELILRYLVSMSTGGK